MMIYAAITTAQELLQNKQPLQADKEVPLRNCVLITPIKKISRRTLTSYFDKPHRFK